MQNQKPNIEERQTVMKKGQKKQITIYKTLHRKLNIEHMKPTKNREWHQILRKG